MLVYHLVNPYNTALSVMVACTDPALLSTLYPGHACTPMGKVDLYDCAVDKSTLAENYHRVLQGAIGSIDPSANLEVEFTDQCLEDGLLLDQALTSYLNGERVACSKDQTDSQCTVSTIGPGQIEFVAATPGYWQKDTSGASPHFMPLTACRLVPPETPTGQHNLSVNQLVGV